KTNLEKKEVIFSDLFEDVCENIKALAEEKGVKLYKNNRSNGSKVVGDEEKLRVVVSNLLSNAVKFTPKGGTVEAELYKKGDEVQLVIKDDGIGISSNFM